MKKKVKFKELKIGDQFVSDQEIFEKASDTHAVKLRKWGYWCIDLDLLVTKHKTQTNEDK